MLLTRRNEYALQAMILLSRQEKGNPLSASGLAKKLNTTPAFMSKIAQQLARAGLVETVRGKRGGLMLKRPSKQITAGEIFAAVDGELVVSACIKEGRCRHHVCPVFPVLSRMQNDLNRRLNQAKLSTFV